MKALVTGATGPVGQAVIARLLAEGHDVEIATRRPFLAERLFGDRFAIHEWHPISEALPVAAFNDCDSVLCLTGAPIAGGRARDREALAAASRKTATRRIIEAAAGRDVRLVVASLAHASAGPGEPIDESSAIGPHETPEARFVNEWEREAFAARRQGASIAIVRLGLVTADSCVLQELIRLSRMGLVANLKGTLIPAISLEDAAGVLVEMLQERAIAGLVHGVAPTPARGDAIMAALRSLAPVPMPLVLPLSLLRPRLGLAMPLLACRRKIVPDVLLRAGAGFAAVDPTERLVQTIARMAASRATHDASPRLPPRTSSRAVPDIKPGIPIPREDEDEPVVLRPQP